MHRQVGLKFLRLWAMSLVLFSPENAHTSARCSQAIAASTAAADSAEPFHPRQIRLPTVVGATWGAIRRGRPESNSTAFELD
jgi:hypothetical protein